MPGEGSEAVARGRCTRQRDIRGLALCNVLARGLAELGVVAFHVEQVVADLERQPERIGERVERGARGGVGITGQVAQADAGADQRAGLERMQAFERRQVGGAGLHVQRLPGAHAGRAAGRGQFAHLRDACPGGGRRRCEHLEGQRLQGIAGQDGSRFVEGDVHGRPAAAQGVVVHGRQVVVHQREGVHALHRAGGGIQRRVVGAAGFAGRVGEQGPQSLAAAEGGMAHRGAQPRLAGAGIDRPRQCRLDPLAPVSERRLSRHGA